MFKPKTLGARLVLLILVTLFLVQGVSVLVYLKDRNELIDNASARLVLTRVAALIRLMDHSSPEQYSNIIRAMESNQLTLTLATASSIPQVSPIGQAQFMQDKLYQRTSRETEQSIRVTYDQSQVREVEECTDQEKGEYFSGSDKRSPRFFESDHDHKGPPFFRYKKPRLQPYILNVSVLLNNGRWLNIRSETIEALPLWKWQSAFGLFLVGGLVIAIMLWILRSNTKPLRKLAEAADKIGRGVETPPLSEEGAEEVRSTIQSFNRMQERQQRFIKDRTLMLAAISHDLRTPLTKLRLQSEFVEDSDIQKKMQNTLLDMENMLTATMNFARDEVESEESRSIDLVSLIQSVCDDFNDQGAKVDAQLPERLVYECKPVGIRRMLSNILENAIRYAESAIVTLDTEDKFIALTVSDDGDGIDEALFEKVFSPFYRIEESRNRETGGMGLGLSVVRSIARLHGGEVYLSNAETGGLTVRVCLPLKR